MLYNIETVWCMVSLEASALHTNNILKLSFSTIMLLFTTTKLYLIVCISSKV